jgi:hypothetical protein
MTYLKKSSFAAGELDPSLHDKTDIKTYYSGLATARNVVLGKTGRIINSAGTWFNVLSLDKCAYYPFSQYITYGGPYIAGTSGIEDFLIVINTTDLSIYKVDYELKTFTLVYNLGNAQTQDEIDAIRFDKYKLTVNDNTNVELDNFEVLIIKNRLNNTLQYLQLTAPLIASPTVYQATFNSINYDDYPLITSTLLGSGLGTHLEYTNGSSASMAARAGHQVVYGFTAVTVNGVESPIFPITKYRSSGDGAGIFTTSIRLPTGTEETVFFIKDFYINNFQKFGYVVKELRIYRKPLNEEYYGLVAAVKNNNTYNSVTNYSTGQHTDYGQNADYTNPPPELPKKLSNFIDLVSLIPTDTAYYNERMLMWKDDYIFFSKINNPSYFLRDFPLSETSSLFFQLGSNQVTSTIHYAIELSGLYVFTSNGIYFGGQEAPISSLNPILKKVNDSVIDKNINPIVTPYGILFVDDSTGSIKTLSYDNDTRSIVDTDISVYSNHLFYGKRVVAWAFNSGDIPYLFVILNDGTAVTLSYSKDEKITAWTRHDTDGLYKDVKTFKNVVNNKNYLITLVYRNGQYILESFSKRVLIDPLTIRSFAHSSVRYQITPSLTFTLLAVSGTWDTQVRATTALDYTTSIGKTFAIYNPLLDDYYYLKLVAAAPAVDVTFDIIDEALPVNLRNTPVELIECHTVVTGLSHLNGKKVSVYSDNEVLGSPNNEQLDLPTYTVSGGSITLPEPKAFSIVGLPYTSDIETLTIDSKDGSMSLDSKIVNSVVVRYSRTRGVYVGKFPEGDAVTDMEVADQWDTEDTVNRPLTEKISSKTYRPYSDWQLQGKVCLRQVDPLPMEVTSIILDVSGG